MLVSASHEELCYRAEVWGRRRSTPANGGQTPCCKVLECLELTSQRKFTRPRSNGLVNLKTELFLWCQKLRGGLAGSTYNGLLTHSTTWNISVALEKL